MKVSNYKHIKIIYKNTFLTLETSKRVTFEHFLQFWILSIYYHDEQNWDCDSGFHDRQVKPISLATYPGCVCIVWVGMAKSMNVTVILPISDYSAAGWNLEGTKPQLLHFLDSRHFPATNIQNPRFFYIGFKNWHYFIIVHILWGFFWWFFYHLICWRTLSFWFLFIWYVYY